MDEAGSRKTYEQLVADKDVMRIEIKKLKAENEKRQDRINSLLTQFGTEAQEKERLKYGNNSLSMEKASWKEGCLKSHTEVERLKAELEGADKWISQEVERLEAKVKRFHKDYEDIRSKIVPFVDEIMKLREALELADDVLVATEWPNVKRAKEKIREALKGVKP